MKQLDLYDKKIMQELDINARISATEISRKIKLPKETVNFRIKRLVKNKCISHFYTIINASRMGYIYYKVFFKFNKLTVPMEEKVIDYILGEKSCANLRISEGVYDICFVTTHKNPNEFKGFMHDFNRNFGKYITQKSVHTVISSCKLNQKFLPLGKAVMRSIYHGEAGKFTPDNVDLKIIKSLSLNARMKLIDIARRAKESPKVINYRIKKLEEKGIIAGYFAALDFEFFRRTPIQVDISLRDTDQISSIIEFFSQTGSCSFASELLGKYDLTIELQLEDDYHLKNIMSDFKEKFFKSVIFYDISRIYREFVVNWSPFDAGAEKVKR